jgi:hypothetical protein
MGKPIIPSWAKKIACFALFLACAPITEARIIFTSDLLGSEAETFRIAETSNINETNVSIEFGNPISGMEALSWDFNKHRFQLSDDLAIQGDTLSLGNDANPLSTVQIIANEGSANEGILRYSALNNRWEISNNSEGFLPIATSSAPGGNTESYVLDIYDATGYQTLSTTPNPMNLDTPRIMDSIYSLSNDTITILQSGVYRMSGRSSVESLNTRRSDRSSYIVEIEIDEGSGFSVIPGTRCQDSIESQRAAKSSASCQSSLIKYLNAGNRLRIVHHLNGTTNARTVPGGSGVTMEWIREN